MILRDNVLIELDSLLVEAIQLRKKFEENENIEVLLSSLNEMNLVYQKFESLIPDDFTTSSKLNRHLHWLNRRLNEERPDQCYSDIINICEWDITHFKDDYIKYLSTKGIDQELQDKIFILLQGNNSDSAIRKSFIVLSERLRSTFNQPKNTDGRELINNIFGKAGVLSEIIEKDERESLRNLFDGLYGVFRNKYMHNDIEVNIVEAESIILMINLMLNRVKELKNKTVVNNAQNVHSS